MNGFPPGRPRETVDLIPIVRGVANLRDDLFQRLFRALREGSAKMAPENVVEIAVTLGAAFAKLHGWPEDKYREIAARAYQGLKVNVNVNGQTPRG